MEDIVVINDSGQQHGHVYLNYNAQSIFAKLNKQGSERSDLATSLEGCLAYGVAPIWMTSNTVEQTNFVRNYVGGKEKMIQLSGSDAPLRFTGTVVRRVAGMWNRPIIPMEKGGAVLGAAVAGAFALLKSEGNEMDVEEFSADLLERREPIPPRPEDVSAYHGPAGYLQRVAAEEARLIEAHPVK